MYYGVSACYLALPVHVALVADDIWCIIMLSLLILIATNYVLAGIVVAVLGIGLTQLTGNAVFDHLVS
jgi:hypothetical protein